MFGTLVGMHRPACTGFHAYDRGPAFLFVQMLNRSLGVGITCGHPLVFMATFNNHDNLRNKGLAYGVA